MRFEIWNPNAAARKKSDTRSPKCLATDCEFRVSSFEFRLSAFFFMSRTAAILRLLRAYESRNVTFVEPDGSWPIVWERARGVQVWDADGREYLDLTAAFGVAAAGHANPRVVQAGQRQMEKLLHAMGDVHPHELKARLARELSRITFEQDDLLQLRI